MVIFEAKIFVNKSFFKVGTFQSIHSYLSAKTLRNFPLLNNIAIIAACSRVTITAFLKSHATAN